jgi:hypothetical protein
MQDKLFPADYCHIYRLFPICICSKHEKESDPVCDASIEESCKDLGCDNRFLVPRSRLDTKPSAAPLIHFSRMASGNSVLKSGVHNTELLGRSALSHSR